MASHEARDNDTESESARHSDHDSGSEGEREDEAGGGAHGSQRDRDHDQRERRRHQNRIAQRNYRKKRQARLKELERKLAEARAIVPRFAPVPPVPAQTNPTPEQAVYTTVERDSLMARLESLERENAELKKHFASCPSLASHTRSEQDARFHPYHNQGYAPSYYPYSSVPGVPPAPFGVPSFSPHPHPVTFHPLPQSYPDYPYYGVHYPFSEPPLTQLRRDLKSISDLSFRPELVDAYVDGVEILQKRCYFRKSSMQRTLYWTRSRNQRKGLEPLVQLMKREKGIPNICNLFWRSQTRRPSRKRILYPIRHCVL
ncbi:hypothetical protein BC830DRAFT_350660 [Chytriomyces sp. MP71]|nr:hypothetical protein BC830DRAFT_350660 [Chytriomyces sp. MP71]